MSTILKSQGYLLVERVRWFRMQAARDRFREELEIINEEFRRTLLSFTRMKEIWEAIGRKQLVLRKDTHCIAIGYHAFACRQAGIYAKLADEVEGSWTKARLQTQAEET